MRCPSTTRTVTDRGRDPWSPSAVSMTSWPPAERPRERMLAQGPGALSDAELLAIFIHSGCAGRSAVDIARGGNGRIEMEKAKEEATQ